jgi:hypothetical protein
MHAGGMPLTKWMFNNPDVLKNISDQDKITSYTDSDTWKILGLKYSPQLDSFSMNINNEEEPIYTKRGMLSKAVGLYDPGQEKW